MDEQTVDLIAEIVSKLPVKMSEETAERWIKNPLALREFLKGLEIPDDEYVVRIDRTKKPFLPHPILEFEHPGIQEFGPHQFDLLNDTQKWVHSWQADSKPLGLRLYSFLVSKNVLSEFFGF